MLTDAELTQMRADIAELLPDSAVIYTAARVPDGMGEFTTTWAASGTALARIDPIRANDQISGGAVQPFTRFRLTLEYGSTITPGNRVTINAVTYNVVALQTANSWPLDIRAEVERA
jgi:head-tail adaptor